MARTSGSTHDLLYLAAAAVVERGLAAPCSLFTPDRRVWTRTALTDLHRRHTAATDAAGDTFSARWDRRLDAADPATVQLAAELMFVHLLFPSDLTPASKRRLIGETLAHMAPAPAVPGELDAALATGAAGSGTAFKLRRMSQLGLLIEVAYRWRQLSADRRARTLSDPYAFKGWLAGVPHDGAHAQREALLHLVHPDTFEAIVSPGVKQRIVHALSRHVPAGVTDVDAALFGIRAVLERRYGPGFQFIDPPVAALWQPVAS